MRADVPAGWLCSNVNRVGPAVGFGYGNRFWTVRPVASETTNETSAVDALLTASQAVSRAVWVPGARRGSGACRCS